jgi:hypothetical protein
VARFSLPVLAPYLVLFAALYAGFGVQSPYLPALLGEHGLEPAAIGIVLAGGTAIKLLTARSPGNWPIGSTRRGWFSPVARPAPPSRR